MAVIFPTNFHPSIGMIQIDANLSEDHSWSNDVPQHNVESGYSVSDAIISRPMVLKLECIVSASPIQKMKIQGAERVQMTYSKIRQLAEGKKLVNVVTGISGYYNMVIVDLSIPRKGDDGAVLIFNITLQHVVVATSSSDYTANASAQDSVLNGFNGKVWEAPTPSNFNVSKTPASIANRENGWKGGSGNTAYIMNATDAKNEAYAKKVQAQNRYPNEAGTDHINESKERFK